MSGKNSVPCSGGTDNAAIKARGTNVFTLYEAVGIRGTLTNLRNRLGVCILVSLVGCGTMTGLPCDDGRQLAVQELLYFGTETPSGHITPEKWAQFLNETVTPRFPNGLSVWQASGQWRSASGEIIREPSYVLSLLHSDDVDEDRAIQELITAYKTRFQQEAVLRVRSSVCKSL
ncbi:MAG: DUF3574 domain-containing protein [Nitrospira sp.]|nr:DUF3574 domain-containing protein [Nitrospira sp.]